MNYQTDQGVKRSNDKGCPRYERCVWGGGLDDEVKNAERRADSRKEPADLYKEQNADNDAENDEDWKKQSAEKNKSGCGVGNPVEKTVCCGAIGGVGGHWRCSWKGKGWG